MVISNEERAVLLKRLEKAREAKVKKQQEAKEAQQKAPVVAPVVELEPIEEVVEEEIALPPKVAVPKKAKKIAPVPAPPQESSDEEDQKPVVKKSKVVKEKKMPYMKLKLYREPSNPVAFQSLLENLNAEYEEESTTPAPPPPPIKPPRVLVPQGVKTEVQTKKINDARALALSFFS